MLCTLLIINTWLNYDRFKKNLPDDEILNFFQSVFKHVRRVGRSNLNNTGFERTTFLIGFTVCLMLSETKGWTRGKQLSRPEDGEVRSLLFGTCNVLPSMCFDKSAGPVARSYPPQGIAPPLFHNPYNPSNLTRHLVCLDVCCCCDVAQSC